MRKVLALDIETTGLDPYKDRITCIGVYCDDFKKVFRDIGEFNYFINVSAADYDIVCHNGMFDFHFLIMHGGDILLHRYKYDTQYMAHVHTTKVPKFFLDWYESKRAEENKKLSRGHSHRKAGSLSLKTLAPYFLQVSPFWEDPENHDNDEYVLKDCKYTYMLFKLLHKSMVDRGEMDFFQDKMMPWAKMLLIMQLNGVTVDNEKLKELKQEYAAKATALKAELDKEWRDAYDAYYELQAKELKEKYDQMCQAQLDKGKDPEKTKARYTALFNKAYSKLEYGINFDSPAQMKWLLKDYLGHDVSTTSGDESTGKDVLEGLSKKDKSIKLFIDWRKTNKVLTSFIPKYEELQDNMSKLHPEFKITGTRTGRLSSANPNFQQIPPVMFSVFKPQKGRTFIKYDLSGIEAVLIGLYSEDPEIYNVLKNDWSFHDVNAKVFFDLDCPVEEVKKLYPKERQAAKTVGFAILYGAGAGRIKAAFQKAGFIISSDQAKEMHKKYKDKYKKAIAFHREITKCFENKEPIRNLLGRPLVVQDRNDAYMQGFNTLVQSSASDLNIRAAEKALERWAEEGIDGRHIALIHDAIWSEVAIEHKDRAEQIIKECMTDFKLSNKLGDYVLKAESDL